MLRNTFQMVYDSWMFFMRCTPPLCDSVFSGIVIVFYVLYSPLVLYILCECAECASESLRLSLASWLNALANVLGSRELAECTSERLRLSLASWLNALANVLGSRELAECTSERLRLPRVG